MRYLLIILALNVGGNLAAQSRKKNDPVAIGADSTVVRTLESSEAAQSFEEKAPTHDPTRAALLSATIPGLGQAYNKKYWKIPLVWGALGAFGYFIKWNDDRYQYYRRNLIYEVTQDPDYPNETGLDKATLTSARDSYRRNRDQLAIYGILFYMLQIVDAHVDAHLIEFDVNQDLSVRIDPASPLFNNQPSPMGLSIKIKF